MSHESQLPPCLQIEHMAQLLSTSVRTIQKRRKSRTWPFTELPRIDRKPRWSRDAVLGVINGQKPAARR
jgi:hypothetical protein